MITLATRGLRLTGHLDPGLKGSVEAGDRVEILDEQPVLSEEVLEIVPEVKQGAW